jgi:hypothetical protein
MRTEDVLAAAGTGLWRWDHATGLATLDALAAGLFGLPARHTTVGESLLRARMHVEDYIELYRVATLVAMEARIGEARLRVVGTDGTVHRTLRARLRAYGDGDDFVVTGTLMEVPRTAHPADSLPRDWRLSREAFLLDAGRALAEARTTGEVLRVAASLALPGFTPDGLAVFGVDGDELTVLGHHGYPVTTAEEQDRALSHFSLTVDGVYPAAEAVRTGRAVYLPSRAEYARRYPAAWEYVRDFGRHSWAYVPLIAGGRTIGAWMAAFPEPVEFTPDERSVLTTVARMLAQALARTHVFETERELSADLQHTMAPAAAPQLPGAQLIARYVPTGGGLQIGGDWYDAIPLPSGRVAMVIGDVQGHDVRAAAVMAQLRIALRAYAAEGHPPDAVLTRASRFLAGVSVDGEGGVDIGNGDGGISIDGEGGVGVGGDQVLSVTGGDLTEDCAGRAVNIASSDATVVLNGACTTVTVAGSNLTVHVGSADSINVIGADNTVHYASGDPGVTDLGSNNSVSSGGDATP